MFSRIALVVLLLPFTTLSALAEQENELIARYTPDFEDVVAEHQELADELGIKVLFEEVDISGSCVDFYVNGELKVGLNRNRVDEGGLVSSIASYGGHPDFPHRSAYDTCDR